MALQMFVKQRDRNVNLCDIKSLVSKTDSGRLKPREIKQLHNNKLCRDEICVGNFKPPLQRCQSRVIISCQKYDFSPKHQNLKKRTFFGTKMTTRVGKEPFIIV